MYHLYQEGLHFSAGTLTLNGRHHFRDLVVLGGAVLLVDLRMLGLGLRDQPVKVVADARGRLDEHPRGRAGFTPLTLRGQRAGSYLLLLRAPGREEVRYPIVLRRGEANPQSFHPPCEQSGGRTRRPPDCG